MNRLAILLIGLAIVGFASGNWRRKETFMEWLKRREPDRALRLNYFCRIPSKDKLDWKSNQCQKKRY